MQNNVSVGVLFLRFNPNIIV